jgi:hypothetical protein
MGRSGWQVVCKKSLKLSVKFEHFEKILNPPLMGWFVQESNFTLLELKSTMMFSQLDL